MQRMRAAVLTAPETIEIRELPCPVPGPREVLVRPVAVGVCGTDMHIYSGEANYHLDARGRPVSLADHPQVLGHEIVAEVLECGAEVRDLAAGSRVIVDQGLNCHSTARTPVCEFCASGDSHQCEDFREHGISGLPGAFAEALAVPAVNAVRIESGLDRIPAAMTEPLACVLHALEFTARAATRYRLGATDPAQRVRSVLIVGAGPAGL
ncbi:MAG TPA: alcohol dehydrogenase catalytic domain-containing protein, partial [Planctomycetota bacterium]